MGDRNRRREAQYLSENYEDWKENLKLVFENKELIPYFNEGVELSSVDQNRGRVVAAADIRLDAMDDILTYAYMIGVEEEIQGWRNTFTYAFQTSPTLCARFKETSSNYGIHTLVPLGNDACGRPGLR